MIAVPEKPNAGRAKASQDRATGCRTRAEADLLAAVTMLTAKERARLETSAASWTVRANLLQHLDDNFAARKAPQTAPPVWTASAR
jgi:hypothetical protein